jgi:hypothetical protein
MIKFFLLLSTSFLLLNADYLNERGFLEYTKDYSPTHKSHLSGDMYSFSYLPNKYKCELKKNGLTIDTFDKRFKQDKPVVRGYKCPAWIKEHYTDCKVIKSHGIGALSLSYGKYKHTNLLLAFNPLFDNFKANVVLDCKR